MHTTQSTPRSFIRAMHFVALVAFALTFLVFLREHVHATTHIAKILTFGGAVAYGGFAVGYSFELWDRFIR
jgi:hypothetical protein